MRSSVFEMQLFCNKHKSYQRTADKMLMISSFFPFPSNATSSVKRNTNTADVKIKILKKMHKTTKNKTTDTWGARSTAVCVSANGVFSFGGPLLPLPPATACSRSGPIPAIQCQGARWRQAPCPFHLSASCGRPAGAIVPVLCFDMFAFFFLPWNTVSSTCIKSR